MVLAIDFDGTVVENYAAIHENVMKMLPGAREAIRSLKMAGHHLILHSARVGDPAMKRAMIDFIESEGLPFDEVWEGKGKPRADIYIDDKGMRFEPNGLGGYSWKWFADAYGI